MSQRKRQKRVREIEASFANHILESADDERLAAKDDSDLFFIDRGGSKRAKSKIVKAIMLKESQPSISTTEIKLIQQAQDRLKVQSTKQNPKESLSDIWGTDSTIDTRMPKKLAAISKKSLTSKILSGLSYNPSHADHQDALAEVYIITSLNLTPHITSSSSLLSHNI